MTNGCETPESKYYPQIDIIKWFAIVSIILVQSIPYTIHYFFIPAVYRPAGFNVLYHYGPHNGDFFFTFVFRAGIEVVLFKKSISRTNSNAKFSLFHNMNLIVQDIQSM
jgi:hypothetical protein